MLELVGWRLSIKRHETLSSKKIVFLYLKTYSLIYINIYIYIYIYICADYNYIIYIYTHIYYIVIVCDHEVTHTQAMQYIYIYIYIYYIVIVCDHEITHTSYAICEDKFLAFLYQQKFTQLYWTFNCNVWSNAWILNKNNKSKNAE